jgi:hypothetical protein
VGRLLVLLGLVVALVPAGASSGVVKWSLADDISLGGHNASTPQIAADAQGDLLAVWLRSNGNNVIVQAALKFHGAAWGLSQDISPVGQDASHVHVAMDAAGDAAVVWLRSNGTYNVVQVATLTAGGGWTLPSATDAVSDPTVDAFMPAVAMDTIGDAEAIFVASDGTKEVVMHSHHPACGPGCTLWTLPLSLSDDLGNAEDPQVVFDSKGNELAVWDRSDGSNKRVQAATRPATGNWSTPTDLSAAGQDATHAHAGFDKKSDAYATWLRSNGTYQILQGTKKAAKGGAWQTAVDISQTGQDSSSPQLAVDAKGDAFAVWTQSDGTNVLVRASTRTAKASAWQATPTDLTADGHDAALPQIAVDGKGVALAVWQRPNGAITAIESRHILKKTTWSPNPPDVLNDADASNPTIAVSPKGAVGAAYQRTNGVNQIITALTRG